MTYKRRIAWEVAVGVVVEGSGRGREGNGSEGACEDAEQKLQILGLGIGNVEGGEVAVDLEPVAEEFPVGRRGRGVFLVVGLFLVLHLGIRTFQQRSQWVRVPNCLSAGLAGTGRSPTPNHNRRRHALNQIQFKT